jgi:hypothetical protein
MMRLVDVGASPRRLVLGVICVVATLSATVNADVARVASLDERLRGANKVVVATARRVDARWEQNEHGDRLIVSRVVLEVQETLKGVPAQAESLDVIGGTLGGLTLQVSSLPLVHVGDRAVFFLEADERGGYRPHLKGQGILFLDHQNIVRGSSLRLDDIRMRARAPQQ